MFAEHFFDAKQKMLQGRQPEFVPFFAQVSQKLAFRLASFAALFLTRGLYNVGNDS